MYPMEIDHTQLQQAARAFATEDHDLAITVNVLLAKIDDLDGVYGDDDAGREAQKAFAAARERIARYSGMLCDTYGTVGVNLDLMSGNVDTADWAGIAALPQVDTSDVPRFGR
jgi:hypothetical protein